MMTFKTIAIAVTAALVSVPASAALFNFRIMLDPGTPFSGTSFVQTFNSSLHEGAGSYTEYPGPYVIETRKVFGSATALDNDLLVALQAETGTAGYIGFDTFAADQFIFDNFVTPKSYSYSIDFTDYRGADRQLSPTLFQVGDLTITIAGNSSTDDPASPLAGNYLDTGNSLRTVLRNTQLRYSAVGRVYTYDVALGQVVDVLSISRYLGSASLLPEPGNWALLIAGFGLVGAMQRRRRGVAA